MTQEVHAEKSVDELTSSVPFFVNRQRLTPGLRLLVTLLQKLW